MVSEDGFREWNSVKRDGEHIDETVESFMTVFHSCMKKVVSKVKIKEGFRRNIGPWLNDEVKAAKHELNVRRRNTPNNLTLLREKEDIYDCV